MSITLEQLTHKNYGQAAAINRDDIPEEWVDNAASLMEVTDYGAEHHLIGHTFLACMDGKPAGLIMIGEALAWDTDPEGGEILEKAIEAVCCEFGKRSLALGVHKDNTRVGRFYERHGFRRTGVYEGNDEYYLRLIGT